MLFEYNYRNYNYRLFLYTLALNFVGILIINSATNQDAAVVNKQIIGILVGMGLAIGFSLIDYHKILNLYTLVYIVCVLSLAAVLVFGKEVNNATRWIVVPGIGQLQPSEFVKIGLIVFFSWFFSRYHDGINSLPVLGMAALLFAVPVGLILSQPNLSTSLITVFTIVALVYTAGISYKWIFGVLGVMIPFGAVTAYLLQYEMIPFIRPYQAKRILAFLNPIKYAEVDYQQANSVMAIGSGKLFGKGLYNNTFASVKNGNFLSEEQTDFIFAVIGEELGFIRSAIIIAVFALLVFECLRMASRAKDLSGRLICTGMAALIAFQTFSNIAVATRLFPNTGLPLPFVSSGVSSLISMYIGIGIVLNVGLQRKISN